MRIVACIKQVPDTAAQIWVNPRTGEVDLSDAELTANHYDELALEEALCIRERLGGEVIALGLGPERTEEVLRKGLASGADQAVHLCDPAFANGDTWATSRVLARALARLQPDLVLCGKKAMDGETGQVPAGIAERLNVPLVCDVTRLEVAGNAIRAYRAVEGVMEVIEALLPAVVSVERGINQPRYPTLKGTMAAKKKVVTRWDAAALGLAAGEVGLAGSLTRVATISPPKPRATGRFAMAAGLSAADRMKLLMAGGARDKSDRLILTDPPAQAARRVLQLLADENLV